MTENRKIYGSKISIEKKLNEASAPLPAMLLYSVTLLMLILDLAIPGMKELQYTIYPVMIRIAKLIGIVCAGICFNENINSKGFKPDRTAYLFMVFCVLMLISTAANGISRTTVFGLPYRYIGVFDIIGFLAIYMYCSAHIRSERALRTVLLTLPIVADLIAIAFVYHSFFGKIAAFTGKREPAALFFHGNHYGYFLTVVIMLSAGLAVYGSGKDRIIALISLALNSFALTVNRTMGAVIAIVFSLIVMSIWIIAIKEKHAGKALTPAVTFVAVILLSFIINDLFRTELLSVVAEILGITGGDNNMYAGNGRWGIWQFTIEFIMERPILGFGCEGIKEILYDMTFTTSPHNEPLTYAAFFGIPAAILYICGIVSAIYKGMKKKSEKGYCRIAAFASLGYFMSSLFGVAVFYTAPFFFIMLGITYADDM